MQRLAARRCGARTAALRAAATSPRCSDPKRAAKRSETLRNDRETRVTPPAFRPRFAPRRGAS